MRKFIVSDLHGNGDVYDSIMAYLDHRSQSEKVLLYINGDLIDRGLDGYRMLMDVKDRMEHPGNLEIHYLGGNRELMMYQALLERESGKNVDPWCNWMINGGWRVAYQIEDQDNSEELFESFKHFLGELKIYHVFEETIKGKPMVLVHAQVPKRVSKNQNMKISDNHIEVEKAVWTRKHEDYSGILGVAAPLTHTRRIGLPGYFAIVGHTPVLHPQGFSFDAEENSIDIDGNCSMYAQGEFQLNQVPLVEVKNDSIDLILFNHDNEIPCGYHYDGDLSPMTEELLEEHRSHLNHQYDHQAEAYQKELLYQLEL
ncbi:MAG: metallophosphoesterase [Bacilli bacterium]|nr:metallophosphoesterase [Bacilli bacterium]